MGGERQDVPLLLPDSRGERFVANEATGRLYDEVAGSVVHIYSGRHKSEFGPKQATGSGYFVDNDGRIMTDAHVVNNSKELWVTTRDGKQYRGAIEKMDDIQDLAIIKLVGVKPGQYKPLESGSSLSLFRNQPIFALGHPGGSRETYMSAGSFLGHTSMLDVLARQSGPGEISDMMRAENYKNPYDFYDFRDNLSSPVIGGHLRLETGISGGPIVDGNGKVVGIAREVEKANLSSSFYSPVEMGDSLLRNPRTKFSFQYAYEPEPWAKGYTDLWKDSPLGAAGLTAMAGGAGYAGVRLANKFSPNTLPIASGFFFGNSMISDFDKWKTSTNSEDSMKFGVATLADATAVGGSIAALFPKARTVGLIALGVGATARLASDFIPNNYFMTGVTRDDGSPRAPFSRYEFLQELRADEEAGRAPGSQPYYDRPPSANGGGTSDSNSDNKGYDDFYKNPYLNTPSGMPRGDGTPLVPIR